MQWLALGLYNRNVGLAHGISEVSNEIFAGWKAPFVYNHVPFQTSPLVKRISLISSQITVFLSLPCSRFCLVTQWALCCVTWIKRLWGRLSFPNKWLNPSTKATLGIAESGRCRGGRCWEVLTRVNVWIFYLPFGRGGHEQRRDCSVIGSKRFLAKTFEKGYSVFLFQKKFCRAGQFKGLIST